MNDMGNITPELPKQAGGSAIPEVTTQYLHSAFLSEGDKPDQRYICPMMTIPKIRHLDLFLGQFNDKLMAAATLAEITGDPHGNLSAELMLSTVFDRGEFQSQHNRYSAQPGHLAVAGLSHVAVVPGTGRTGIAVCRNGEFLLAFQIQAAIPS